jgi:hypothetical protein
VASSPDSSVGAVDALVAALDGLEAVDLSPTLRSAMPRFFAQPEFHIIDDARLIERDRYRLQTLVLPEHAARMSTRPRTWWPSAPRRRWTRST